MATGNGKVLRNFEFKQAVGRTGSSYDWDTILDGKIRQLTHGEEYDCKTGTIVMMARNRAKKRGLGVRTTKVADEEKGTEGVVLQAYQLEDGKAE